MRLIACALLAVLIAAGAHAQDSATLVATRRVTPARFDVTIPEKVGLIEAGEHRELAFEVSGRLVTLAAEGASVSAGEPVATLDAELEKARLRQADLRLDRLAHGGQAELGLPHRLRFRPRPAEVVDDREVEQPQLVVAQRERVHLRSVARRRASGCDAAQRWAL